MLKLVQHDVELILAVKVYVPCKQLDMICYFDYIKSMRKIVIIAIISLFLSTISSSVYALTSTPSPTADTDTAVGEEEEATKTPTRTTTPASTGSRLMEIRKAAIEKFQSQREEFQEKLADIKETRKKNIVERVDEKISNLNERHTTRLNNHLTRMSEVLAKIEEKAADKTGDSADLDAAITKATAAIETAQTAVDDQAGKEYVIEFDDESELGTAVRSLFASFKSDIQETHMTVKEAHKAVVDVAKALGSARSEGSATNSDTNDSEL